MISSDPGETHSSITSRTLKTFSKEACFGLHLYTWTSNGWHDSGKFKKSDDGFKCESVGFIMFEDKKSIRLACSYSDQNETAGEVITIPRANVIKKEVLKRIVGEFKDD